MNFTISTVAKSLAEHLSPYFPGVAFYEDPNSQNTSCPCMFLQQRFSYTARETGGFWRRRVGLVLTFLLDFNLPDLQRQYQKAAERLDILLDSFPYTGGGENSALLKTHEREWRIEQDALYYQFELIERVTLPQDFNPMGELSYKGEAKDGG